MTNLQICNTTFPFVFKFPHKLIMSRISFLSFRRSITKKPSFTKEIQKSSTMRGKSFQPNTQELRNIFSKFDANGDGKISLDEYKQALKVLGAPTRKNEAVQTFQVADADGDGFIDFDEFSKVYGSNGRVKSSDIQAAFRVFDRDGDGKISAEELMEVLRRMGEKCSLDGCKKMIKGVDTDGDGLVNMDDFMNMMMQTTKN